VAYCYLKLEHTAKLLRLLDSVLIEGGGTLKVSVQPRLKTQHLNLTRYLSCTYEYFIYTKQVF
jgi:hypothetical protein